MLAPDYPVTVVCVVLGIARSSYYYQPLVAPDEARLRAAIKQTAAQWPKYGYRRITAQLRRAEQPLPRRSELKNA